MQRIETERAIVCSNRELIRLYEEKVKGFFRRGLYLANLIPARRRLVAPCYWQA